MFTLFADPHPDELLYSAWARSAACLRYPNRNSYFTSFTEGQRIMPIVDFPCHLNQFVDMFSSSLFYSVDTLIQAHTLYPYYRPFLPIGRAQKLYEVMCGDNGKIVYRCTNLENSNIPRKGWFRYCSQCVMDDRIKYGECYWHRLHQIHGVLVCPKHHLLLVSCTAEEQDLASRGTIPAEQILSQVSTTLRIFTDIEMKVAERIATSIAFLLEHPQPTIDLHLQYRLLLERHHLLQSNGTLRITEIVETFKAMFSHPLLKALGCAFEPQTPPYMTWLSRLLKQRTMCQHPLLHILTIIFFQEPIEELFCPVKSVPGPFGLGPWPCLNPACPHYRSLVILTCQVNHQGKARRCTGHFTCSCGFKYMRILREDMDSFRKDSILQYGSLWEQKLQEVWTNEQLSLKEMTRLLGASEMALQRQSIVLGLPQRTQGVSSTIYNRQQHQKEADRQLWCTALKDAKFLSRIQLRQKYRNVIYRLRRYDREWFNAHSLPPAPKGQGHAPARSIRWTTKGPVDWSERDTAMAEMILQIGTRMKEVSGKPIRVTMAQLTKAIPELGWLKRRNKEHYVQSRATLKVVLETQEAFILRKIPWLMRKWEEQHIWLGQQRFLELSGAHRLLHNDIIKKEVNKALTYLMRVLPDKRVNLLP